MKWQFKRWRLAYSSPSIVHHGEMIDQMIHCDPRVSMIDRPIAHLGEKFVHRVSSFALSLILYGRSGLKTMPL